MSFQKELIFIAFGFEELINGCFGACFTKGIVTVQCGVISPLPSAEHLWAPMPVTAVGLEKEHGVGSTVLWVSPPCFPLVLFNHFSAWAAAALPAQLHIFHWQCTVSL